MTITCMRTVALCLYLCIYLGGLHIACSHAAEKPQAANERFPNETIRNLPICNLSKTNHDCKLVMDRTNPVVPPTVQMYSGQTLILVVKRPLTHERYFLDLSSSAATLTPDVLSTLTNSFAGPLAHFQLSNSLTDRSHFLATKPVEPDPCGKLQPLKPPSPLETSLDLAHRCVGQLSDAAIGIYRELEPLLNPDALTDVRATIPPDGHAAAPGLVREIVDFTSREAQVSATMTLLSKNYAAPGYTQPVAELASLQKVIDSIAQDLLGYSGRLHDLNNFNNGALACSTYLRPDQDATVKQEAKLPQNSSGQVQCVVIATRTDDQNIYGKMTWRSVTYGLDVLNLVSNSQEAAIDAGKKKALGSIVVNFADEPRRYSAYRWEASAGVFFSTLAVRSFSAAPVYTNQMLTDYVVAEDRIHPTVVPFVGANYRLTDDIPWFRWKSNLYITLAAGINPNTTTADFGAGLSLSWRSFMLSALCHWGHETRLKDGFVVGQDLTANFSGSVPTETHWVKSFALGISVRAPSLTGR